MIWFILILAAASALWLAIAVRRRWVTPWPVIQKLVDDVREVRQPRTYLIEGNTEAKRVALALEDLFLRQRALTEQIGQSEFNVSTIINAMEDGLVVLDESGRIRLTNPAFRRLFSLSESEAQTTLIETLRNAAVEQLVQRTLQSGDAANATISTGDAGAAASRRLAVNAVAMRDAASAIKGAVVLFRDVTMLTRTDEIRRDFVANVSHELRTPLSIFHGYVETLRDDPEVSRPELRRIVDAMERHSRRMNSLVEDLLSLAQLEVSDPQLEFADVELGALLGSIGRDWEKRFASKQLALALEVAPDLPRVRADELRLQEIVYNLFDNALKYSHAGGRVRVSAHRENTFVKLSVSDEGVGIPAADLPRIFERFYCANKARSRELGGTGLGLSIVKHIAQLHGGRVEAESALGKGTTISVFLPVAQDAAARAD
ncbi:MAG: two-component system, OmpR family, phosphate regulon sensor histidine kinase PhoR [Verrucomicrobiota bacterium]|jgi:two-component system phosphate regulon sensor histidine kinase PhoR